MNKHTSAKKIAPKPAITPMMGQFLQLKSQNKDCLLFFRMGDFYELFFDDAVAASRALGIVLTKRGKHLDEDIPMCGVPVDRAEEYLGKLIRAGFRVAVAEQIEDPKEAKKRGPKSVVQRDVIRLITPATLVEDHLLDPIRANFLAAIVCQIHEGNKCFGLAIGDISTGHFEVLECPEDMLEIELARYQPSEVIYPENIHHIISQFAIALPEKSKVQLANNFADPRDAEQRLTQYFQVKTTQGFGAQSEIEKSACALLVSYVQKTLRSESAILQPPRSCSHTKTLEMDSATRSNLEILLNMRGEREGSLFDAINSTVTAAGARLLAHRLTNPSTELSEILQRLEKVDCFFQNTTLLHKLRNVLKNMPDIERAFSRIKIQRASPRDLFALAKGVEIAHLFRKTFEQIIPIEHTFVHQFESLLSLSEHYASEFLSVFMEDLPLTARDGDFIQNGVCEKLDYLRRLAKDSRLTILELQSKYAEMTGLKNLKIKQNQFLGFFIEVPLKEGEDLRTQYDALFIHRQTMSDAMRFSTIELAELDEAVANARNSAIVRENEIFQDYCAKALTFEDEFLQLAQASAEFDFLLCGAFIATEKKWCKPTIDESLNFYIEDGRHPIVEASLKYDGLNFIPNHCALSVQDGSAGKIALITGPNMGGKSTYLRQNALIVLLAQSGLFVPAKSAHIGIVDKLFTRVGASDDLSRGRSTFMVEMVETATILNRATPKSLVILDEIGRGTSTYDGMSIAQAAIEHIHDQNQSRCLFATHFHELTTMVDVFKRLFLLHVKVKEHLGQLIFLHKISEGVAHRSYGIQVAKLAGIPQKVLDRAQKILHELEHGHKKKGGAKSMESEPLPLFDNVVLHPTPLNSILEKVRMIDPDQLTPREALEALYDLKKLSESRS